MQVIPFIQKRKDARGNTQVFGIQDPSTKLWFVWCYTHEHIAQTLAMRLRIDSPQDQAANWRATQEQCVLSDRDTLD